jgi:hypothetical protein
MDEVREIIRNVTLKHNDSGEASIDRLARLILKGLEDGGYEVVKSNSGLDGVGRVEQKHCINCGKTKSKHSTESNLCDGRFSHFESK